MTLRLLISLSLLPLTWQAACAQPADEFFHHGAQSYLSNNVAKAREEVDHGRKLFPDDIKLKKLDELLKQQQQQQQSKNDQEKQDQEKKDQQQQQQQDQQNQQQQSNQDQQKQDQQTKSSGGKKDQKDEQQQGEPSQPMQAQAMTPQEAKQLLDAQKGEERTFVFGPTNKTSSNGRVFKDW